MLLGITLLAPLCGPLLVAALGRRAIVRAGFDAFLIVAVGGLLVLHVLPEGLAALGWPGIPALLIGLALPKLLHGEDHDHHAHRPPPQGISHDPYPDAPPPASGAALAAGTSEVVLRALGAAALLLHAAVDGVALTPTDSTPLESLAVAVGLHRLIEGAGIWWLLRERVGRPLALAALVGLVGVTALGFAGGHWALAHGFVAAASFLQMMVAGSLVHLLVWHPPSDEQACSMPSTAPPARWPRIASATGALVAVCALLLLEGHHDHPHGHDGAHAHAHGPHLPMVTASLPLDVLVPLSQAMLLALVCAALAHAISFWPRPWRARPMGPWQAAVFGLFVPACSCGVVALAEGRKRAGTRSGGDMAYLLAAPAMGWVGFIASMLLLGPAMTLVRATLIVGSCAAVSQLLAALFGVARPSGSELLFEPSPLESMSCAHAHPASMTQSLRRRIGMRLSDGLHFAFGEMLDFTAPWLSLSFVLVLVMVHNVPAAWVQAPAYAGLDVYVLALLALPVYLCAASSTLVATCLWRGGASSGAILTFLLVAPSLSIASISALRRWRGGRAAAVAVALHGGVAVAAGLGLNALAARWPLLDVALWPPLLPRLDGFAWPLALAALLGLTSLMRQGLRGFVGQLLWANGPQVVSKHHP